jgi:predicted phage replisome organizer
MADVKWIKLTTDMFDNRKIKHLRRLPEGNNIVLIWVMLLTMAGRCNANGMIFLTENIPYTTKMLADELDFEENTVKLALEALKQLNMVVTDSGHFTIAGWEEYQNIEGMEKIREQNRIRKQRQREKQKALPEPSHGTSRDSHATDIEEEKELDKDKKKKKEQKTYSDVPELNQAILSFIEFRKSIKKPMTDHAVGLLFKKLNDMTTSIDEQIEIINQSIVNGWQGVFPLKEQKTQQIRPVYHKQTKAEELEDFYRMCNEWSES